VESVQPKRWYIEDDHSDVSSALETRVGDNPKSVEVGWKKIEDNVVVEEALDSVSRRNYTGHQKTQNALQRLGEVD